MSQSSPPRQPSATPAASAPARPAAAALDRAGVPRRVGAPARTGESDRAGRAGWLAAAWAGASALLALVWTVTGRGYPFGAHDRNGEVSLLRLVPPAAGAPLYAGLLLVAAVLALAVAGQYAVRPARPVRLAVLGLGWLLALVLLVVVPDARVLIVLGYAPMLLLGAPFGWPPVDYSRIFDWPLANKLSAVLGGLLLVRALLSWQFRTAGGCAGCGRRAGATGWTSAAAAAGWGRWAARVAAVIPLLYAATRFAWAAGIPLGISPAFLAEMHRTGLVWAGAGLGAFAVVGAILTTGLVRPWGEAFPRWLPGLAGRRVPISLAVVPALLVGVAVTAAGVGLLANPQFWRMGGYAHVTTLPMMLWPLWGAALVAAAAAYHLRRRGACARCGRSG
ncbi:hypothetical protein ACFFWC_00010 [Plantactinospora siamensis]|uniref:Uncharacterized protein n=1 Tax=Plantactinospora siamensis TaxID=555372 RepID=A0ABV6NTZ2_9ACTN